jgi:hypothetical protein
MLEVTINEDKVEHVKVIRGAPCGSTWHMADGLKGVSLKDAPAKAGLLIQQYPCRAVRGNKGGIHESAKLHKDAVSKLLSRLSGKRNISFLCTSLIIYSGWITLKWQNVSLKWQKCWNSKERMFQDQSIPESCTEYRRTGRGHKHLASKG